MPAKKQKTFRVGAVVKAWVEIEVDADSLEAAIEVSRTLKMADFVSTKGEFNDYSHQIVGVSVSDFPACD